MSRDYDLCYAVEPCSRKKEKPERNGALLGRPRSLISDVKNAGVSTTDRRRREQHSPKKNIKYQ